MSEIEKFLSLDLDKKILSKSSNDHSRRIYIRSLITKGLITKDLLWEIFEERKYTVDQAQKEIFTPVLGKSLGILAECCEKFGIIFPNASESAKRSMKKRYDTNKQKYGGTGNVLSKGSRIEKKRNKIIKEKYGVDNVFQLEWVKEKIHETSLDRYGVKYSARIFGNFRNISKPHKIVSDYLKKCGVYHENEVRCIFLKFNKEMGKEYSPVPDILIESKKTIIEIYGDYWHCNPLKYKPMDIIESRQRYGNEKYAKDVWNNDRIRENHMRSFGYNIIILWETDIINENYKEILNGLFEIRENNQN